MTKTQYHEIGFRQNRLPVTAQNNAGKVHSQWFFIQPIYLSQQNYLSQSQKLWDVLRELLWICYFCIGRNLEVLFQI